MFSIVARAFILFDSYRENKRNETKIIDRVDHMKIGKIKIQMRETRKLKAKTKQI